MDLFSYRRRMEGGTTDQFQNTKRFINENFTESPFFQQILFNDDEIDAIVNAEKEVDEKTILLRPTERIDKGEVIEFNNHKWLVMDFNSDEIYPTLKVQLCNQRLNKNGVENPVVAIGKKNDLDENGKYLITTTNEIVVFASYQKAKDVNFQERFYMGNREFEVIGIDSVTEVYQGKGIVKFTLQVTGNTTNDTDQTPQEPIRDDIDEGTWGDW